MLSMYLLRPCIKATPMYQVCGSALLEKKKEEEANPLPLQKSRPAPIYHTCPNEVMLHGAFASTPCSYSLFERIVSVQVMKRVKVVQLVRKPCPPCYAEEVWKVEGGRWKKEVRNDGGMGILEAVE